MLHQEHYVKKLAADLDLIDKDKYNYLWVVNWPLLEYDEEKGRYSAAHHPFTMPKVEDVELLETAPEKAYAQAYDIVLNGYELGGGSIRIYDKEVQSSMFKALGSHKNKHKNNLDSYQMHLNMVYHLTEDVHWDQIDSLCYQLDAITYVIQSRSLKLRMQLIR